MCLKLDGVANSVGLEGKKKCDFCLSGVLASCGLNPALEWEAAGL